MVVPMPFGHSSMLRALEVRWRDSRNCKTNLLRSWGQNGSMSAIRAWSTSLQEIRRTRSISRAVLSSLVSLGIGGRIGATGSGMVTLEVRSELTETDRRKLDTTGVPVRLADGRIWLLCKVNFRSDREQVTWPDVDGPLDRIFDQLALGDGVPLRDILESAVILLRANYELSDAEVSELLEVATGSELTALVEAVLEALFGGEGIGRRYTDWVRASLISNGFGSTEIPAAVLPNVLAVLVTTGRSVPSSRFVESCRAACTRTSLESLV